MLEKIMINSLADDVPLIYEPKALNIFVGPNNSGKSLLLREIYQDITNKSNDYSPILVAVTRVILSFQK